MMHNAENSDNVITFIRERKVLAVAFVKACAEGLCSLTQFCAGFYAVHIYLGATLAQETQGPPSAGSYVEDSPGPDYA